MRGTGEQGREENFSLITFNNYYYTDFNYFPICDDDLRGLCSNVSTSLTSHDRVT